MYDEMISDTRSEGVAAHASDVLHAVRHDASAVPRARLDLHAAVFHHDRADESTANSWSSDGEVIDSIAALIEAMTHALAGESESARRSIQIAGLALARGASDGREIASQRLAEEKQKCRGGLAPWQVRRLSTHIENHLAESVQCDELAVLVNLSLSHFMRAFRESFGCPPHAYLMRRRMECAQGLMLTTNTPLGQIALECGLADQSHLSRLFHKFVGETPAAWRRARVNSSAA